MSINEIQEYHFSAKCIREDNLDRFLFSPSSMLLSFHFKVATSWATNCMSIVVKPNSKNTCNAVILANVKKKPCSSLDRKIAMKKMEITPDKA